MNPGVAFEKEASVGPDARFVSILPACEASSGFPPEVFLNAANLFCRQLHPDEIELGGGVSAAAQGAPVFGVRSGMP